MKQLDSDLHWREYPENPFAAVGTIVRYIKGVDSRVSKPLIETMLVRRKRFRGYVSDSRR